MLEFNVEMIWTWPSTKKWPKYITYLNRMTVWNTLLWIYAEAKIKLKICYQFYWDHVITAFWNDHWCVDNFLSCLLSFKLTQIRVNNVNIPIPFYILENNKLFSKMCLTKIISFIHFLHWTESYSLVFLWCRSSLTLKDFFWENY